MALSKCPGCGVAVSEGANFCTNCGRALGDVERPPEERSGPGPWIEFLDQAWDFFASTKVAAVLIVLVAIASAAGTLIEQESLYQDWRPPAMYYPVRYGDFLGNLYMKTGLTHTYSSVWYATLVLLIVISLVIGSLQRLIPLHRVLTRPQVWKVAPFIQRQQVAGEMEGDLETIEVRLRKLGYKMVRDRECLYGDKGRLSRYGPYIIHIGLILVALAAFAKGIPGWDLSKDVWVPDGQTVKVPDTDFAITNYKFTMDLYPNGAPSRFATDAGIVDGGREVQRQTIEVNSPLSYKGWEIYQASFRQEPGVAHVKVIGALANQSIGTIDIDLRQPESEYVLSDQIKLVVRSYYHDFVTDPVTQQGTNASFDVKNPVLLGEFADRQTGAVLGRAALVFLSKSAPVYEGPLYLAVESIDTRWFTALKLHKDRTTPFMYGGLAIVMLGMLITFFLYHWQIWVRAANGKLLLGARAYKNKFGLKQEFKRLLGKLEGEGTAS